MDELVEFRLLYDAANDSRSYGSVDEQLDAAWDALNYAFSVINS